MAEMRLLERTLSQNVSWNRARIKLLARLLVALVQVKTVNLAQLASVLESRALIESNYKRLQRFLRHFELPFAELALLLTRLLDIPRPWVVTLDRTEWHCAQARINLLVMGVAYKGAAIPILWTVLPKAGSTSFVERRALVDQFICLFGRESISYLCADREFHGKQWYQYLGECRVKFCLRVRSDTPMTSARGPVVKTKNLFRQQKVGIRLDLERERVVWGQRVRVSGLRLTGGELLVVVSSPEVADPLAAYTKRWEIETLFGCLKTRGFCLEATRVSDAERLKKLMALLALSFCWAIKAGEWVSGQRPLKYKTHKRLARSLFRTGLDSLRRVVCNLHCLTQKVMWRELIHLLSCT
jgi:hypothetical protein